MRRVIILRGLPGSGKSDLADFFLQTIYPWKVKVVSADNYFKTKEGYNFDASKLKQAHAWCFGKFCEHLEARVGVVVVDNTNTQKWEFQKYLNKAKEEGYKVTVITVENHHEGESVHSVPEETIFRMKNRFEHYL